MEELNFDDLSKDGFRFITNWMLYDGIIRLSSLEWEDRSGWLYAFVVQDKSVKYIGKTERVLRSRMDNYRDGKVGQNRRLRNLIALEIATGHTVSVYGRQESEPDIMSFEEARLLSKFNPEWNQI